MSITHFKPESYFFKPVDSNTCDANFITNPIARFQLKRHHKFAVNWQIHAFASILLTASGAPKIDCLRSKTFHPRHDFPGLLLFRTTVGDTLRNYSLKKKTSFPKTKVLNWSASKFRNSSMTGAQTVPLYINTSVQSSKSIIIAGSMTHYQLPVLSWLLIGISNPQL